MNIIEALAKELNLTVDQVEKTVALIDEGNTIPFIARYLRRRSSMPAASPRTTIKAKPMQGGLCHDTHS